MSQAYPHAKPPKAHWVASHTLPPTYAESIEDDYNPYNQRRLQQRRLRFSEINITPLTDIFLVLLIIMMVVAPFMERQGLQLVVPRFEQSASSSQASPKILHLTLDAQGQYETSDGKLSLGMLTSWLKTHKDTYPDGVTLSIHPQASHKALMLTLEMLQQQRITNISMVPLVTEAPTTQPSEVP
jgi:biopolymer transport protein ExbD